MNNILVLINLINLTYAYEGKEDCGDLCIGTIIGFSLIFLMCCVCCLRGSEEDDENQGDSDIV